MSNATLEWIGKKTEQLPSIPKDVERWVTPAISVAALALGAGYVYSSYGTRRSKNGPQEPPVVSAYIPWFGSFWAMNRDPDGFMDSAALVQFLYARRKRAYIEFKVLGILAGFSV